MALIDFDPEILEQGAVAIREHPGVERPFAPATSASPIFRQRARSSLS
ncbi:MAG TPA: hypothetical protein VN736_22860 [Candidatus Limnocylindrales bacterium]|nr:hypothetical protein [Candidatus Limnocylindrales bacterium]